MRRIRPAPGREPPGKHMPYPEFEPPEAAIFTPRDPRPGAMSDEVNAVTGGTPPVEASPTLEAKHAADELPAISEDNPATATDMPVPRASEEATVQPPTEITVAETPIAAVVMILAPNDTQPQLRTAPEEAAVAAGLLDEKMLAQSAPSLTEGTADLEAMDCDQPLPNAEISILRACDQRLAEGAEIERQKRQQEEQKRAIMIFEAELRDSAERAALQEAEERRRKEESSRHADAAEARMSAQREMPMEIDASISELTLPQAQLRRPYHLDREGTSQHICTETRSEAMDTTETTTLPDVSRGAIPKKPRVLSVEQVEGRQAQQWSGLIRDGERRTQRVQPIKNGEPPLRILPVESPPIVFIDGECWDEAPAVPTRPSNVAPPTTSAPREPHLGRIAENRVAERAPEPTRRKKNKRRGNPERRQLTVDDYVSQNHLTPPSSPEPGPPSAWQPIRPPTAPVQPPQSTSSTVYPVKTSGIKFGGLVRIPTDPALDPPPFTCFNCWGRGHPALRCPLPQQRVFCFNCGRRDVDLSQCPRCSEPHRRYIETEFAHERCAGEGPIYPRKEGPPQRPVNDVRNSQEERVAAATEEPSARREPAMANPRHEEPRSSRSLEQPRRTESRYERTPERRQGQSPAVRNSPERRPERHREEYRLPERRSVYDRLGPRVESSSDEEGETVMGALHIAESLVRYAFGQRRRNHRRHDRRDEHGRRD